MINTASGGRPTIYDGGFFFFFLMHSQRKYNITLYDVVLAIPRIVYAI